MKRHTGNLDAFIKERPKLRPAGQPQSEAAKQRDNHFAEKASAMAQLKETRLASERSAPAAKAKPPKQARSMRKATSPD